MFNGTQRRVVCMWFPRLPSDRVLRARPVEKPFALTLKEQNAERLYCLNTAAEQAGLNRGMSFADARAFCPDLISQPAHPEQDARFLSTLRRWASNYCPWVGFDGIDGLVLDVTGSTHLWGGEQSMIDDMSKRAQRVGMSLRLGLSKNRGSAWALAHYGRTPIQETLDSLPVSALRLDEKTVTGLQRLGLRTIGDLKTTARAPLARRFGKELMFRMDQLSGAIAEPVAPQTEPPNFRTRMTLPEPIGLLEDVMGITNRLLVPLCKKLKAHEMGARQLMLTLRRVDQESQQVELRLAAPVRDPNRILPLFERGLGNIDAGFGIEQICLEATLTMPLAVKQINTTTTPENNDRINDLITRMGTRIGLENIQRFLPADSHIPERSFIVAPASYSRPSSAWASLRPRPLRIFRPEPISGKTPTPPTRFSWRRLSFSIARMSGPERITPEWWLEDDNWRSGLRDYWKVDTYQGRRLWLFYTPQNPGWFVQGEFA